MDRQTALRAFTPALREVTRTLLRTGAQCAGVDPLTATEADMLRLVVREPGLSPGRIAVEMHMKPSNVSAAIRHLTELGLVSRESDPADRRAARLVPTERAVDNTRRIEDAWACMIEDALGDLPADDAEALLRALPALRSLEAAVRARGTA
ncbi:MarR family winged helix-turn-helix transcriptional regulator [Streptomyces minutiscleroticus]|uniref:MarR family transcriptional regulator n=1 Tax=Streptomyces minutiscleroticus TaxID=68238 RepID=A0A918NRW7_9ACTN|nr:MarR family transcriptional regulator [Streptomyces minutiscleroticus]GGX89854.1 MarR family transcriptional regulator [Streptomyces minutiscleroticus]